MGWSRSKDGNGGFQYTLTAAWEELEVVGGYATYQEADRAAEAAERLLMSVGYSPELFRAERNAERGPTMDEIMSDDELLRELMG